MKQYKMFSEMQSMPESTPIDQIPAESYHSFPSDAMPTTNVDDLAPRRPSAIRASRVKPRVFAPRVYEHQQHARPTGAENEHRHTNPTSGVYGTNAPLCTRVCEHVANCATCSRRLRRNTHMYMAIIVGLSLFIMFLLTKIIDKYA